MISWSDSKYKKGKRWATLSFTFFSIFTAEREFGGILLSVPIQEGPQYEKGFQDVFLLDVIM